jgi:hypothetical protein
LTNCPEEELDTRRNLPQKAQERSKDRGSPEMESPYGGDESSIKLGYLLNKSIEKRRG